MRRYQEPSQQDNFNNRSRSRGGGRERGDQTGREPEAIQFGRGGRNSRYYGGESGSRSEFSTTPMVAKFAPGTTVQLRTNHFKIGLKDIKGEIHIYKLEFGDGTIVIDNFKKHRIMVQLKQSLESIYMRTYSFANTLMAIQKVTEPVELETNLPDQEATIVIRITYQNSFSLDEQRPQQKEFSDKILMFCSYFIKRIFLEKNFKQVGRLPQFYDVSDKQNLKDFNLQIWNGYSTSVQDFNDGYFLCVETATKFINNASIFDIIRKYQQLRYSKEEIKDELLPHLKDSRKKRLVVITEHNSQKHLIDDLTFDFTPRNYMFTWTFYDKETKQKVTQKTNVIDYFAIKYNIQFKRNEEDQPMLIVNQKDNQILLPTSLCFEASLPKDFVKDKQKMKILQNYKISKPADRYERTVKLMNKIESVLSFKDRNTQTNIENEIKLNINPTLVKATILQPAEVLDQDNQVRPFYDYEQRNIKLIEPMKLVNEKWVLVYASEHTDYANQSLDLMRRASTSLGIKIEDPQWIEIPDAKNGTDSYLEGIQSDIDPQYTIFTLVIIKDPTIKSPIKAALDKLGVPSQFILTNTIS